MRALLLGIAALVLPATLVPAIPGTQATATAPRTPPPGFVLLFLDDMRKDDLVAMPQTKALIGRRGARFANAYSTFPLCCPARATILTGQYAHNHGVLTNQPPLGGIRAFKARETLGTWLRRRRFATAYVGRYLNGYGQHSSPSYVPFGWTEWQAVVHPPWRYRSFTLNVARRLRSYPRAYQTDVVGNRSVRFIRRSRSRPFLLVASFIAPHSGTPLEDDDPTGDAACFDTGLCRNVTPNVSDVYADTEAGRTLPRSPAYDEEDVSDKPGHVRDLPRFREEFAAVHQELYEQRLESIRSVDDQVRAIVQSLRATGRLRNTYIVVTSDNGFMLGEHRIPFGKVHHYEPSSRVPMLMRGPGVPARTRVRQLVGLHDLAPTVLRATRTYGAQRLPLDGRDLVGLARNPRVAAGRDLLLEAGSMDDEAIDASLARSSPAVVSYRGIRTDGGWKYVEYSSGDVEMYDLGADPDELVNLAEDPAFAARRAELDAALDRLDGCRGRSCRVDAER
jgi:N-acetylglucosamine-6-sulfatase